MAHKTDIYAMELHEKIYLTDGHEVMRVAGGWIYHFYHVSYQYDPNAGQIEVTRVSSTFVPFDNQFQDRGQR